MTDDNRFLVVADHINATQRELISAEVKKYDAGAWHQLNDVWIVGGGRIQDWHGRLIVFVPSVPSSIYIFRLPRSGERGWSAKGPKGKWEELLRVYAEASGLPPTPTAKTERVS
jgi:hypothetical protein